MNEISLQNNYQQGFNIHKMELNDDLCKKKM